MKDTSTTDSAYQKLKEKVLARRPILKTILEDKGTMPLFSYAKTFYGKASEKENTKLKNEFLAVYKEEVARLYGEETAIGAAKALSSSFRAANTEHHGIMGTDRPLNNNLILSLPFFEEHDKAMYSYYPILACANISFNNWTFPRGFSFHTYTKHGLNDNQLVFFGHTVDAFPLFQANPYKENAIKEMKKSLYTLWNEKYVGGNEYKKLLQLIDEVFLDKTVLGAPTFTDQAAMINTRVWKKVFAKLGVETPDIIFLEQERLANLLIAKHHLFADSPVSKILFDPKMQALFTKHFEGITCGFSEKTQYGTYLFWGMPRGKKYRTQLWLKGNALVAPDNSYRVALTPDAIATAIQNNELVPSMLLVFIVCSFYYGLRQIGGPNQTTFLTQMKEAYLAMQNEYGDTESAAGAQDVVTTDLMPGTPPILAFLQGQQNEVINATPLDLYLYGRTESGAKIKAIAENVTLDDAISRTYPLWYKRCYTEDEQEATLTAITANDIDTITGVDKKMQPIVRIELNRALPL